MRALVTGGAGFLGGHVVERLVAAGHAVEVVDDLSTGGLGNLAAARAEASRTGGELRVHTLDVRAPELDLLVGRRRPDVVFHLAGRPGPRRDAAEVAWLGTLNVLEVAAGHGIDKVVVGLSGRHLYGRVGRRDLPVREGAVGPVATVVGAALRSVVDLLGWYREHHAVEFTALAFADVYGPRQATGPVAACLAGAGRPVTLDAEPTDTFDLVYVDDAVDAVLRAATRGSGLVVNVGTGVQTAARDLHRLVCGVDAPPPQWRPRPDGVGRFALSPVRARIHLGWAAWTDPAAGIAATRAAVSGTGPPAGGAPAR